MSFRWVSAGLMAAFTIAVLGASSSPGASRWQEPMPFREYPSFEGSDAAAVLPDDWDVPAEVVVGRLMYPSAGGGRGSFNGGDWRQGNTGWTDDYPRGDRALIRLLLRKHAHRRSRGRQPKHRDAMKSITGHSSLPHGRSWQPDKRRNAKQQMERRLPVCDTSS